MWYNNIPDISFPAWLADVVQLFDDVLGSVMALPVLRFLLVFLLFQVLLGLFVYLIRQGQRGRI